MHPTTHNIASKAVILHNAISLTLNSERCSDKKAVRAIPLQYSFTVANQTKKKKMQLDSCVL